MQLASGSDCWTVETAGPCDAETERLVTLGLVSAALDHEIANSLALIHFAVDELVEAAAAGRAPAAETMQVLVAGRDRLSAQTHSALRLGRSSCRPAPHDLGVVVAKVIDVMCGAGLLRRATIDVRVADEPLEVIAPRGELDQLVIGLVVAAAERSRISVCVARRNDRVCMEVDVTGAASVMGRCLVHGLGGTFTVLSALTGSSTVVIELPEARADAQDFRASSGVRETVR